AVKPPIAVCSLVVIAGFQPGAARAADQRRIAVAMPVVQGMPGNAVELASGIRDLVVSYLSAPSMKVVPLEARLPSQAVEEAKQKGCEPLLVSTLSRKLGGGGLRAIAEPRARRAGGEQRLSASEI